MSKIQILPDIIVNQIAAGEVVERPAAVVKELVENSIDSGAEHIVVRFSHGGKYSIIVEDDGCGLSSEDALLAFERHATSKISKVEDINDITTFGFRGEALPSIASVSKFTMRTRTEGSQAGTEIVFNGGKLINSKECGTPNGTIIQVEQLFHNTPARRLFLKTEQTESNLIINLVKNFAFAERDIHFELYSETKKIFSSPINYNWVERTNEVFFEKEHLLPIKFEKDECKIEGVICDPNAGNPCKKFLSFFVNRRQIDSKLLRFAVNDALAPVLPKHREVIACLLITLSPKFIDVNVHPTKREIRFRNEQFIKSCVAEAIDDALGKRGIISDIKARETFSSVQNLLSTKPAFLPKIDTISTTKSFSATSASRSIPNLSHKQIFHEARDLFGKQPNITANLSENSWKFIGQMFEHCAIFESQSGVIFVNLKLAVTKILYEKLKTNIQSKNIQTLLFPIDMDVSDEEAEVLIKLLPFLTAKGIEIYQFGENQYRISGIPEWLSALETETMIRDIISNNTQYNFTDADNADSKAFASLASKYAKYEPQTSSEEIQALVDSLLLCENCALAPNGFSTFFEIPKCDFIKRFGKI